MQVSLFRRALALFSCANRRIHWLPSTDDDQTQRAVLSPRARALREAQDRRTKQNRGGDGFSGTRTRRYVKSDSLYFLQRGMEERERQRASQQVAGSNDNDRHSAAGAVNAYSYASDYF